MDTNILIKYFSELGIPENEARVYLSLLEKGGGTPLTISRSTGINRTKIYRLLETMQTRKLISLEVDQNTTKVSPAPIQVVQKLLKDKQETIRQIAHDWPGITQNIEEMTAKRSSDTKVKFYHGKAGIEQMVWNVLKAKDEIVGYTFRDLSHFVGEKFMKEFAGEFKRRNLKMRDIHGDEYLSSTPIDNEWGENMNSRYLPKKILAIPHQTDIYDDVVSFYSWNGSEVWGTEIYNEKVATMQKQLFELAWEKAKKR